MTHANVIASLFLTSLFTSAVFAAEAQPFTPPKAGDRVIALVPRLSNRAQNEPFAATVVSYNHASQEVTLKDFHPKAFWRSSDDQEVVHVNKIARKQGCTSSNTFCVGDYIKTNKRCLIDRSGKIIGIFPDNMLVIGEESDFLVIRERDVELFQPLCTIF